MRRVQRSEGARMRSRPGAEDDDTLCPIAHSTGLVGDRWSILIVRELLMGQTRFQDLQAQTGATSQMLATRLDRLVADGVVERQAYSVRPVRYDYRLTPKGLHLMPVILALRAWGEAWCKPDGRDLAVRTFHGACGSELSLEGRCPTCARLVGWTEMRGSPTDAYLDERNRRASEFARAQQKSSGRRTRSKP